MKATIVLGPGASKRLIAKGVAAQPLVRRALVSGTVVITLGTTNAAVAEEVLGRPIDREAFAAGFVDDRWNLAARVSEAREIVLRKGQPVVLPPQEVVELLQVGDVVIKGGNAIDPWGTVGVLTAAKGGGTVGRYLSPALARGVDLVIPISLGKLVQTSILDLARELGSGRIDLAMGLPAGMQPLVGEVVTEVEALEILFGVSALHVASGGVGRGAGSVSLLLDGPEEGVRAAFTLATSLVAEEDPPLRGQA